MIPQTRLQTGIITVNHKEINSQFKQFYTDLYTSESSSDTSQLEIFLNDIEFPTISEMSREALERDIQIEDTGESIASLKSGKAPGGFF